MPRGRVPRSLRGGQLDESTINQKTTQLDKVIALAQTKCMRELEAKFAQERAELIRQFTLLIRNSPELEDNFKVRKVKTYFHSLPCASFAQAPAPAPATVVESPAPQQAGARKRKTK